MATEKEVTAALKNCYDPEIPVNIVDLGLVYEMKLDKGKVYIKMTLTSPTCPLGDMVKEEITNKLMTIDGVKDVQIDLVFNPPWNKDKMSKSAKRQLGMA
ncbi:MAG TPA: metal-sulfur cluster assembly factor [archaeon]|nr:metal-sulfur cluster assembly factor [archaeon]